MNRDPSAARITAFAAGDETVPPLWNIDNITSDTDGDGTANYHPILVLTTSNATFFADSPMTQ